MRRPGGVCDTLMIRRRSIPTLALAILTTAAAAWAGDSATRGASGARVYEDPTYRHHAQALIANPGSACSYAPDGWVDVREVVARREIGS